MYATLPNLNRTAAGDLTCVGITRARDCISPRYVVLIVGEWRDSIRTSLRRSCETHHLLIRASNLPLPPSPNPFRSQTQITQYQLQHDLPHVGLGGLYRWITEGRKDWICTGRLDLPPQDSSVCPIPALRTKRALLLYKVYDINALLVLNGCFITVATHLMGVFLNRSQLSPHLCVAGGKWNGNWSRRRSILSLNETHTCNNVPAGEETKVTA